MTDITATVSSQPITASVSGSGNISASVGSSSITASAGGGIGPQGPAGSAGSALGDLAGVTLTSVQEGDLLQYSSGKWSNNAVNSIVDFGNF
jgi:hypothetical protein